MLNRLLCRTNSKVINFIVQSTHLRRTYAKPLLRVNWDPAPKVPEYSAEKTGDLQAVPLYDDDVICHQFIKCKAVREAPECVRRLFTVNFRRMEHTGYLYRQQLVEKVRHHPLDTTSFDVQIAERTADIRYFQFRLPMINGYVRRNTITQILKLTRERHKLLTELRESDYKRYEWLLVQLDVKYWLPVSGKDYTERTAALTKLSEDYCVQTRANIMMEYHQKLQKEQPAFLRHKLTSLQHIIEEEKACGVKTTVSAEEIERTRQQLDDMEAKLAIEQEREPVDKAKSD